MGKIRPPILLAIAAATVGCSRSSELSTSNFGIGMSPFRIAARDFDGDSKLDLAVLDFGNAGGVGILRGRGDGSFALPIPIAVANAYSMAVADFNGDGKLDVAVSGEKAVTLLLDNGDGTLAQARELPLSYGANAILMRRVVT